MSQASPVVIAYSGDEATSAAIPWLAERYAAPIVTVTVDVGQGRDLTDIQARALSLGAVRAHVTDARERFAADLLIPALRAETYSPVNPSLGIALSRAIIARETVAIARLEGARVVATGSRRRGRDRARVERLVSSLDPALQVLALPDLPEFGHAPGAGLSIERNLWGRRVEWEMADGGRVHPDDLYSLTRAPADAPHEPAVIRIGIERSLPVSLNGVALPLVELFSVLETVGGSHAIGRADLARRHGELTRREVSESPAAALLHLAYATLRKVVVPKIREQVVKKVSVGLVELIEHGSWYSPRRTEIESLSIATLDRLTGTVSLELSKGECRVVDRESPFSRPRRSRQGESPMSASASPLGARS